MEGQIKLGRIWGIPIGLHGSWFIIFILVTWSLAAGYFPGEYPRLATTLYWILGGLTSVLFFGSVLLHELGHAFVALRNKIPVERITLFIFGGVAQIAREPLTPGAEFRIALAGPAVSLGLAGIFGALWLLNRPLEMLAAPSIWLARINLMLALFNMIPGFPLDGGRVFRAIVWKITGDYRRATTIATTTGQMVAFGFIAWGVFTIFQGNLFNGLWLAFIGWFLQNAAAATYAQMTLREMLRGATVSQIMVSPCQEVPASETLAELVNQQVFQEGQQCFFVAQTGQLDGLITLKDISSVPRERWTQTTAREAMTPQDALRTVAPTTELIDALTQMDLAREGELPVVERGELVGMLSREQIIHYVRMRSELNV